MHHLIAETLQAASGVGEAGALVLGCVGDGLGGCVWTPRIRDLRLRSVGREPRRQGYACFAKKINRRKIGRGGLKTDLYPISEDFHLVLLTTIESKIMKTVIRPFGLAALVGFLSAGSFAVAHPTIKVGGPAPITEQCLIESQQDWIAGLLSISSAHRDGGDYRAAATDVLNNGYNFQAGPVLFKPTLTHGEQTFRTTFDGALAYFVGGNPEFPGDDGFALKDWVSVHPQNVAFYIEGNTGLTMGHFTFTNGSGTEVTVEKTFAFRRGDCDNLRIVLHKSTIPFNPGSQAS